MLLDSELFALNAVRQAAHSHWRAGRWLLERITAQQNRERNHRPLTPNQLRQFTAAIAVALDNEVNDDAERQHLTRRLTEVLKNTNRSFVSSKHHNLRHRNRGQRRSA